MSVKNNTKKIHSKRASFLSGTKSAFSLVPGVIPFGLIMGTTTTKFGMSFLQGLGFNLPTFAGASQFAGLELYTQNASLIVIILTCMIINIRFTIYSFSLASFFQHLSLTKRFFLSYLVTDQSFGITIRDLEDKKHVFPLMYYLGAAIPLCMTWHLSVIAGMALGNFIPDSWSLDFSIPLIFMALLVPLIRNRKMFLVALVSAISSLIFYKAPLNLGILVTVMISLILAKFLIGRGQNG